MVVGEMAPKSWAISHPEQSSSCSHEPFRLFVWIFRPVIRMLNGLPTSWCGPSGWSPRTSGDGALADRPAAVDRGVPRPRRHRRRSARVFARSLELSGLTAADAMTLRRDIVAVGPPMSPSTWSPPKRIETGRTRVVVHEGDLDHVLGFVHAKDMLRLAHGTWPTTSAGSWPSDHGDARTPPSRGPPPRDAHRAPAHRARRRRARHGARARHARGRDRGADRRLRRRVRSSHSAIAPSCPAAVIDERHHAPRPVRGDAPASNCPTATGRPSPAT
jgi:hypothetical protein